MCRWIVDADRLQAHDFDDKILYRNPIVESFINNDRNLGIESPKGMGKTFLMKCKRMKSQDQGIRCFPQDSMCDILDKVTFEDSMLKYLEDYSTWIDLWKISVCLSLIKSDLLTEAVKNEIEKEIKKQGISLFDSIYQSLFIITPCQIMNQLLNGTRSDVRNLQLKIPTFIAAINLIRQPVHIFIDKTDQALRDNIHIIPGASQLSRGPNNNSYWAYAQLALAEASYSIFAQNAHIKVFFSIRSEAFVGAESCTNLFLQIRNYIVKLDYDYNELYNMFKHYVSIEKNDYLISPKDKNDKASKAFMGVEYIPHGYVQNPQNEFIGELFFDYIFRHSLKRPRDIMHICYSLCYSQVKNKNEVSEVYKEIRHVVNKESRLILQAYLREMGPFVFDNAKEKWELFWKSIGRNVFTIDYAKYVCNSINALDTEFGCCDNRCNNCLHFKPFSALYNTGLLGIISNNNVIGQSPYISFQSSGNVIINTNEDLLPTSDLYFLHPMLTNKIQKARKDSGQDFHICNKIIVGDHRDISEKTVKTEIIQEKELLSDIDQNKIFISSTCYDLDDERKMIFRQLNKYGYSVVMSDKNDFGTPDVETNSYDYCLDQVLKCNKLIFIIGKHYGGVYRGSKYKALARDIAKNNQQLKDPSISLMEFCLAQKRGIQTYVFVKNTIYNERNTYMQNKGNESFTPAFVSDNNVFEILSYVTRLPQGNWIKRYEDLQDLEEIIKIEFEK